MWPFGCCTCVHNKYYICAHVRVSVVCLFTCLFGFSSRAEELDHGVAGCLEGTIKLEDAQGVLNLGKLRQKYIENEDLRKILAETTLDASKMKNFDEHELLLITSVIYSEKFELKGKRIVKV